MAVWFAHPKLDRRYVPLGKVVLVPHEDVPRLQETDGLSNPGCLFASRRHMPVPVAKLHVRPSVLASWHHPINCSKSQKREVVLSMIVSMIMYDWAVDNRPSRFLYLSRSRMAMKSCKSYQATPAVQDHTHHCKGAQICKARRSNAENFSRSSARAASRRRTRRSKSTTELTHNSFKNVQGQNLPEKLPTALGSSSNSI